MKVLSRLGIGLAVLATAWLLVCAVIGIAGMEMALHPGHRLLTEPDGAAQKFAASRNATLADVFVSSADGITLRGWIIRPVQGNGDAVILLHGQSDNRIGMLGYADLLLRHGYAVLLPDARAHGLSGGNLATYGVLEADDVQRWFRWLAQTDSPRCIDGLGESMGAAELLQSLRVERGFCAVVAESTFSSFREASCDRLGEWFHAGSWLGRTILRPAVDAGFLYARARYGIDFRQASPEIAVAESRVPVLLIHGKKDTNLPPRHSEQIMAVSGARVPPVVLWEPAEAEHTGAIAAEPTEFETRVIGWFAMHVSGRH